MQLNILFSRLYSILAIGFCTVAAALGQPSSSVPVVSSTNQFSIGGYGIVNYGGYNWASEPKKRNAVDVERFAIEPTYRASDMISFEAEIEWEHGGTGGALVPGTITGSGDYEHELEKGGEVELEVLAATVRFAPEFNLRLGHFEIPVGLDNTAHRPDEYFPVLRNESETSLMPATWHQTGIDAFGAMGQLAYQVAVINGLESNLFTTDSWIHEGSHERFEYASASDLAVAARLDYNFAAGIFAGVSGYYGNSANNRPEADLAVPAHVAIGDVHAVVSTGSLLARGEFMYGSLENAGAVTLANMKLSEAPLEESIVGSAAMGYFLEAGYDLLPIFRGSTTHGFPSLYVFGRMDAYNPVLKADTTGLGVVDAGFSDNLSNTWQRTTWTAGLNYKIIPQLVLKADYSTRQIGKASAVWDRTFALGVGMTF